MSKMKFKIFLTLFLLVSCGESGIEIPASYQCDRHPSGFETDWRRCVSEQYLYKEKCDIALQAKFIIDCAKAANPMSDEEGEDLVAECRKTSNYLFCKKIYKNDHLEQIKK